MCGTSSGPGPADRDRNQKIEFYGDWAVTLWNPTGTGPRPEPNNKTLSSSFSVKYAKNYTNLSKLQKKWPKKLIFVDRINEKTSIYDFLYLIQIDFEIIFSGPGSEWARNQNDLNSPDWDGAKGIFTGTETEPWPNNKTLLGSGPGPGLKKLGPAHL